MFGAEKDVYFSTLDNYKRVLLSLYNKRTKLMAEREALRFKYTTNLKTKLRNLASAIVTEALKTNDYELTKVVQTLLDVSLGQVFMADASGRSVEGFASLNYVAKGSTQSTQLITPLSPLKYIVEENLYGYEKPFYKDFVFSPTEFESIIGKYYVSSGGSTFNSDFTIGVPPSLAFFDNWKESYFKDVNLGLYDQAASFITANYPQGNLPALIQETQSEFFHLLNLTNLIILNQRAIDIAETDLKEYVAAYAASAGAALNASDILNDLQAASEGNKEAMMRLGLFEQPSLEVVEVPPEGSVIEPAKPGNALWVAGAAALYFLMRR